MKKFLVAFLAVLSLSAFADRVLVADKDNYAVLKEGKCEVELFKDFKRFDELKSAVVVLDGVEHKACYLEERGNVVLGDDEGTMIGPFPSDAFVHKD